MSAPTSAPSPPRSTRPLAARKRPNDPTWFSSAPSVPSVKRQATDRMESEQRKRKRVEPIVQTLSQPGHDKQNEEPPVVSAVYHCYYGGGVWWADTEISDEVLTASPRDR